MLLNMSDYLVKSRPAATIMSARLHSPDSRRNSNVLLVRSKGRQFSLLRTIRLTCSRVRVTCLVPLLRPLCLSRPIRLIAEQKCMCPLRWATLDMVSVAVRRAPLALGLLTSIMPRVALAKVRSVSLSTK